MIGLPHETLRFFRQAVHTIRLLRRRFPVRSPVTDEVEERTLIALLAHCESVSDYQRLVLRLEHAAQLVLRVRGEEFCKGYTDADHAIPFQEGFYPEVHEVVERFMVDGASIDLECVHRLVSQSEIPVLRMLLNIPKSNEGLALENHASKGYHFHYGYFRGSRFERTSLLLTFDPASAVAQPVLDPGAATPVMPPLLGEQHAEKDSIPLDITAIGQSRRPPIYQVCLNAGRKRGFKHFKRPGSNASVFFKPM